jgi:hypothetical protein
MTTLQPEANEEFERFLTTLFLPDELIELRFIESWLSRGRKKSRVVRPARWLRRRDVVALHGDLAAFAKRERANVYFGVCPRPRQGDADDHSIRTVRCVWCDIDHVTTEEAHRRWMAAGVPKPSIVVSSGTGVHGYWLLDRDLTSHEEQSRLGAMLPSFYGSFGGDHVQNLSRVMRPPGTVNYKDARNSRRPLPCTLCACDPELRYPLATFSPWMAQAEEEGLRNLPSGSSRSATEASAEEVLSRHAEAAALVSHLDKPSRDRSRRDFAIVCDLLRLGLRKEEIWSLVSGSSKFESNGRRYFDLTITNAERSVLLDGTFAEQTRAST